MGGNSSALFGKHHSLTGTDYLALIGGALLGGAGLGAAGIGPLAGLMGSGIGGGAAAAGTMEGLGSGFGMGLAPETAAGVLGPIADTGFGASMAPGLASSFGLPSIFDLGSMGAVDAGLEGATVGGGGMFGNMFDKLGAFAKSPQGIATGLGMMSGGGQQQQMPQSMSQSRPAGGENVPSTAIMSSFYGNRQPHAGQLGAPNTPGVALANLLMRKRLAELGFGGF